MACPDFNNLLVFIYDSDTFSTFSMATPANRVIDMDFKKLVITSAQDLLETGKFSDFKIICQDEQFLCHKNILKKKSDVLLRMFEADMLESKTGVLREGF